MNAIDAMFGRLRLAGRKAFIPFLTAGDPDLETTAYLLQLLAGHGADLIEIGFPYSDPIADGPVIQASYTRALQNGLRIGGIFDMVRKCRVDTHVPVVGMVSYSLVRRRGPAEFLSQAQGAGFDGLIVPDLPVEESAELLPLATEHDLKLIQLVTPTTPRARAIQIARASSGFLYYVSTTGITGERDRLPTDLVDQIRWLRTQTALPICVGFGISKPEHVRILRDVADGIIVGSALVRKLEPGTHRPKEDVGRDMTILTESLVTALHGP